MSFVSLIALILISKVGFLCVVLFSGKVIGIKLLTFRLIWTSWALALRNIQVCC